MLGSNVVVVGAGGGGRVSRRRFGAHILRGGGGRSAIWGKFKTISPFRAACSALLAAAKLINLIGRRLRENLKPEVVKPVVQHSETGGECEMALRERERKKKSFRPPLPKLPERDPSRPADVDRVEHGVDCGVVLGVVFSTSFQVSAKGHGIFQTINKYKYGCPTHRGQKVMSLLEAKFGERCPPYHGLRQVGHHVAELLPRHELGVHVVQVGGLVGRVLLRARHGPEEPLKEIFVVFPPVVQRWNRAAIIYRQSYIVLSKSKIKVRPCNVLPQWSKSRCSKCIRCRCTGSPRPGSHPA